MGDESLLLWEDGRSLRNQVEEEEHPLHLGGAVGLGVGSLNVQDKRRTPLGVGGAFWAGWDVWVAPEWSLGGRLRVDGMYGKDGDVNASSVGASVMFSVLYH